LSPVFQFTNLKNIHPWRAQWIYGVIDPGQHGVVTNQLPKSYS
jgi:hypothetical protein